MGYVFFLFFSIVLGFPKHEATRSEPSEKKLPFAFPAKRGRGIRRIVSARLSSFPFPTGSQCKHESENNSKWPPKGKRNRKKINKQAREYGARSASSPASVSRKESVFATRVRKSAPYAHVTNEPPRTPYTRAVLIL